MYEIGMKKLNIIIPVALELDWPTRESVVTAVLEQNRLFGFSRFALACPGGGWRSVAYPPKEVFREGAELFLQVKNQLNHYDIECGWWITTTIKSGPSDDFIRMVKADGAETPFASCPLDPAFRKRLAEDMALFAKISKPAFIFTEDDYSVMAATGIDGCFCKYHLQEFAKRQGRNYSRGELTTIFAEKTEESIKLLRDWRGLIKDTLVDLSAAIRIEVDKETPEIPIGYMQSGCADAEGDCTEAVARAMAGPRHTPFSRICGMFYGGVDVRGIPEMLYHPLYCRQHIKGNFHFIHESDTFPHTRFYTAGAHMRAIMAVVYSYGYEGSTFQTQQLLDVPNEESAYGKMFAAERGRFNTVCNIISKCRLKGVQLAYDPFWHSVDTTKSTSVPLWTGCVSRFGIPYTTAEADVAFWDERQARYYDDETVLRYLSRGLFLDGDAARRLCERGYGEYIGVDIGEDVAQGVLRFDLGAREVICESYVREGNGRNMPSAHMFSPGGNGKLLKMTVTDPICEVISEAYTFQKKLISPAMTRFKNKLGGRVVVMGMTLDCNKSQSLFNYRRQRLIQELIVWCADEYVFVREAPEVFTIVNEAVCPEESRFGGMMTLINLCEDELNGITLHFPPKWQSMTKLSALDQKGEWQPLSYEKTDDGVVIKQVLHYLTPMYILGEM